ncbi:RNA-directed DNA polymerase [Mesorhizobium sp. B2-5-9]|uniref:RNA-directed DNA polymerase n=3 Tax=Phyllobacteriaceae TaxID=69277 RepID=UPI000A320ECB|nr:MULTISPECIES: RNA-directed DNA polymerase [unclassified Mesorhizobium]TPK06691.1 RNA-directed DNA polymerase [Mesorhizobium sp. B2-5-9]
MNYPDLPYRGLGERIFGQASSHAIEGLLSKRAAAPFITEDFGEYARELLAIWAASGPLKPSHAKHQKFWEISETEPELYSTPKAKNERRQLHITNPVPQLLLASVMTRNWATISRWLDRQRFSFSRTMISSKSYRAIEEPDFKSNAVHKQLIRATYDVEVKSDVLRFYPSIYTHSVLWAAYGKERVKKNRKKYNDSLGDRIDVLLRKCNRGQSVGIPIGPDTSRIVADILSGYIDSRPMLRTGLQRGAADRLQDDWVIGTETVGDAERLLSALRTTYLEVGLEIHGGKTSVIGKTVCPLLPVRWLTLHCASEGCSGGPSRSSSQEDEPWQIIGKHLSESMSLS